MPKTNSRSYHLGLERKRSLPNNAQCNVFRTRTKRYTFLKMFKLLRARIKGRSRHEAQYYHERVLLRNFNNWSILHMFLHRNAWAARAASLDPRLRIFINIGAWRFFTEYFALYGVPYSLFVIRRAKKNEKEFRNHPFVVLYNAKKMTI